LALKFLRRDVGCRRMFAAIDVSFLGVAGWLDAAVAANCPVDHGSGWGSARPVNPGHGARGPDVPPSGVWTGRPLGSPGQLSWAPVGCVGLSVGFLLGWLGAVVWSSAAKRHPVGPCVGMNAKHAALMPFSIMIVGGGPGGVDAVGAVSIMADHAQCRAAGAERRPEWRARPEPERTGALGVQWCPSRCRGPGTTRRFPLRGDGR
jgi:hypothetical protein